jgi:hypothetical protein
MTEDFAKLLADFAARSSAPGADQLRVSWPAAELALRSPHERDTFTWFGWAPDHVPRGSRMNRDPVEQFIWATRYQHEPPGWVVDNVSHNAWYWGDITQQILRLRYVYRSKLSTLLLTTERALVEANLLVAALLLRSFFENTATVYAAAEILKRHLVGFELERLDHERVTNDALRTELEGLFGATRFNWQALASDNPDAWLKKPELQDRNAPTWPQILDHIDQVAANQRYGAFRHAYAWLCEYVHPNVGSHLIFLRDAREMRGRLIGVFSSKASRDDTIVFLAPFAGAICSCLEIAVTTVPLMKAFIEPLVQWCDSTCVRYPYSKGEARDT